MLKKIGPRSYKVVDLPERDWVLIDHANASSSEQSQGGHNSPESERQTQEGPKAEAQATKTSPPTGPSTIASTGGGGRGGSGVGFTVSGRVWNTTVRTLFSNQRTVR